MASEQERARQEASMAGGPVSRGASNKSAPMNKEQSDKQPTEQAERANPNNPDYNKLIPQSPTGTTEGDSMSSKRDLGTVGGGTIPGSGTPRGGMNTSNSTVGGGGTSAGGTAGAGSTTDRGNMTNTDTRTSTNQEQEFNQQARGNIGGRNPNQPQTSMGDRDNRRDNNNQKQAKQKDITHGGRGEGTNEETTDPMRSHTRDKIDGQTKKS